MSSRLFIIDGHALIFKMYYAFLRRPMVNSSGVDTSILFGFTKYILELIEKECPSHLAVAFDPPGGTFRNEIYSAYKANRGETPQLVIDALEPLMEICKAMNIPVLMVSGFEADDVIGSLAVKMASPNTDVYMVTPDKDYGQLISEHIFQFKPGKSGSDNELIGVEQICSRYGINNPKQVIDMLTICGDTADNVPGVKGIGEVWAGKLVSKYGSIDEIYANMDDLTEKQAMMFKDAEPHIGMSRYLVTIRTDVELDVTMSQMEVNMNFNPTVADLFAKYEFFSLQKYIAHIESSDKSRMTKSTIRDVLQVRQIDTYLMIKYICMSGRCSICVEPDGAGIFAPIKQITIATTYKGTYVACVDSVSALRSVLEDPGIAKYGYDLKKQINLLENAGVTVGGKLRDIQLIHYLIDPEKSHSLDILVKTYVGVDMGQEMEAGQVGSLFDDVPVVEWEDNSISETAAVLVIGPKVWNELQALGLTHLYDKMEEPLIRVLGQVERNGVKVDMNALNNYAAALRSDLIYKENEVRRIADNPDLNVSSPKQLGEVIFENLKLDPNARKNNKTGWSTDEETLLELRDKSPIIDAILDFRSMKKLLSTYIDPFPRFISPVTGRVHTTFNQALTSTGRLSSSAPNLQNIPIRTDRGKEIRKAFVAEDPEGLILSADYSQIELRIMAHLSGDSHLLEAFNAGIDVHAATAAKIFWVSIEDVTAEQRRIAKMANFGIMYGISAFGLSQRLRISRAESKQLIENYFNTFPSISVFIEKTVAQAREKGYVETLFGRRRYLPDINSKNGSLRSLAERNAVNAPIQGTSADIIKLAMVRVSAVLKERKLKSRMVLQIHDELLFETIPSELEILKQIVKTEMENVISLSVPLIVECGYGKNWLEAH